jgi:hypothetical protein
MINSVLHDVGTASARDLRGQGGFDVPSLLGIGLTAPYLHDGSATRLEELLGAGHPAAQEKLPLLDLAQIAELIRFLHSIGPDSAPLPAP